MDMPIRYRVTTEAGRTREGEVGDVGELQGLVSLGSVSPADQVALDGEHFRRAKDLPELKQAFAERPSPDSAGRGSNTLLFVGVGLVAFLAIGLVVKVTSALIGLAAIGAFGLGAIWLIRRLFR